MKQQKYLCLTATFAIGFVTLGSIAVSNHAWSDSVVDSIRIKVPLACTMSGVIDSGDEHSAIIQNGIYQEDIGLTQIKTICNDKDGFAVYAVGYTDNEYGKNVLTSNTLGSSHDIATGLINSGNTSNWSMKLATDSTATYPIEITNGFDSYSEVPSNYAKVASRNSATDTGSTATGANFTTTYATYIGSTQPAGRYTGKVKYTLVHPSTEEPLMPRETPSGYIGYYANAKSYSGSMNLQPVSESATSSTLTAPSFSREGYGFAGWNDKFDYTGNFYGPNEDIFFEAGQYTGSNKGLSLYAVWVKSEGSIQNWTGCPSLAVGSVTALTDLRDGNTYAVAKLADNKCWTIENMRLDDTVSAEDMASGSSAIGEGFSALPSSSNNWSTSSITMAQFNNTNLINSPSSYGGYYSWPSTVASTANYISGIETVNTSICPTGWRPPSGGPALVGSNADYYILMKSLTNEEPNVNQGTENGYYEGAIYSNSIRKYPNNLVLSGRWSINVADSQGEAGFYWTATSYNNTSAYYFYINKNMLRPGNGQISNDKYQGNTFRCIASN